MIRYSNNHIPELVKTNLLLFNRIVGSADEVASLINELRNSLIENNKYEDIIKKQNIEIERLRNKMK